MKSTVDLGIKKKKKKKKTLFPYQVLWVVCLSTYKYWYFMWGKWNELILESSLLKDIKLLLPVDP